MRNSFYCTILALALAAFYAVGCTHREDLHDMEILYGKCDSVEISVGYMLSPFKVKVNADDMLLEDYNIYLVDQIGNVVYYSFDTVNRNIKTAIYENMRYSLFVVANAGKALPAGSRSEIEKLKYSIDTADELLSSGGGMIMTGCTEESYLRGSSSVDVELRRVLAKVVLRCDCSSLNSDVSIDLENVALRNIPSSVNLFSESRVERGSEAMDLECVADPSSAWMEEGMAFYQFENMQGTLLPDNMDQTEKLFPDGSLMSQICSYIELSGKYSSPRKSGNIIYRFYLGKDAYSNFDIERNTEYRVTVSFNGDGGVDENTWRVDNSEISDLPVSILITPSAYTFTALGSSKQFRASVYPESASQREIIWSSSNPDVATVTRDGLVTSVSDGTCVIYACAADNPQVRGSSRIEVESCVAIESVTVIPQNLDLYPGETALLEYEISPKNASESEIIWSSDNEDIATVDASGEVKAVAPGTCCIIAESRDYPSVRGYCDVTVKKSGLSITPVSKVLYIGESFNITYSVQPPALPSFLSMDENVATVTSNGTVTAVNEGETEIKVSANGFDAFCSVRVLLPIVELAESSRIMYDGEEATIPFAKLLPEGVSATVTAKNSNVEIVSVSASGIKIRAVTPGECIVKAAVGNVSDECLIDIRKLRIEVQPESIVGYRHFYTDIEYKIYPEHASYLGAEINTYGSEYISITDPSSHPVRIYTEYIHNGVPLGDLTQPEIIRVSVKGRDDVYADVSYTTKGCSITDKIRAVVNERRLESSYSLELDVPDKAREGISASWQKESNGSFSSADIGDNAAVDYINDEISFKNPNGMNGKYRLLSTVIGDDGVLIILESDIWIYEGLYLVGISKPYTSRVDMGGDHSKGEYKYLYENEVVAKWLSSPNSLFFPNGEVRLDLPYSYKGNTYNEEHTGVYESYNVTMKKNQTVLELCCSSDYILFNGSNAPKYYYQFFPLSYSGSRFYEEVSGEKRLFYIIDAGFASGYSNTTITWDSVFRYLYE